MRALAALLLGWVVAISAAVAADAPTRVIGAAAPEFSFPDLSGKSATLERWRGKVVLVNFWATWCVPCRKEIPMLNALAREYRARGVEFVGIAVDNPQAVKQFMTLIPIDYTVLIGGGESLDLVGKFGNRSGTLPFTAFVKRDGVVGAAAGGALTENYTRTTLEKFL